MRLLTVMHGLNAGGTERQLLHLLPGLAARGAEVHLATLQDGGALAGAFQRSDIALHALGQDGTLRAAGPLVALARRLRPDLVHAFLPLPNLLVAALRPLLGGGRVVCGVRLAGPDPAPQHRLRRWLARAEPYAGYNADLMISNSHAGCVWLAGAGVPKRRLAVVGNGIDTDELVPAPERGAALRAAWGILPETLLFGMVARLDPFKDHPTLLRAFAKAAPHLPDAALVLIGAGDDTARGAIAAQAGQLGIAGRVHIVGHVADRTAAFNALDLVVHSARLEGFPNAVAEAMACGKPVAATAAGDIARIIDDTGEVVPVGAAEALAEAILRLNARRLAQPDLGARARARVVAEMNVSSMVARYGEVLEALVAGAPLPAHARPELSA